MPNKQFKIDSDAPKVADAKSEKELGVIVSVSGPVVVADNMLGAAMFEQVRVGPEELLGEVIRLEGETATLQVYEETTGLTVGDHVRRSHKPFSLELGPGIMGETFDGIQRPLHTIAKKVQSAFIPRGVTARSLDRSKTWEFQPISTIKEGSRLTGGDIFGLVHENKMIQHKLMVPPHALGKVTYIAEAGSYNVDEELLELEFHGKRKTFTMVQIWPVRRPRPSAKRLTTEAPLVTGQRVLDVMCPTVQGGTTALPGPFGCGKCLGKDTPVLMADGSFKNAQDVVVGDSVMGDDGNVRQVLSLNHNNTETLEQSEKDAVMEHARTLQQERPEETLEAIYELIKEQMYEVTVKLSETSSTKFTCNTSHVLSIQWSNSPRVDSNQSHLEVPYVVEENGIATAIKIKSLVISNETSETSTSLDIISKMNEKHESGEIVYLEDYISTTEDACHRVLFTHSKVDMAIRGINLLSNQILECIEGYHMPGVCEKSVQTVCGALEIRPIGHDDFFGFSLDGNHRFIITKNFLVTHNSVISQAVSKWSNSDGIVYCATGERGNEVAEVLEDFPELSIPVKDENGVEHQEPVMQRTTLIANTSNMPIAARELSIYTAISIAEYYRDMGYNISLMADSTSRWAEALREQGSRLGEMPADGGYPAYLGQRLAAFYERAGRVQCLGSPDRQGSVTVIGAVSPAGGDFSDAVVQSTLSVVQVFWALDRQLAARKHFPAINTSLSYTKYEDVLNKYYKDIEPNFMKMRATTQQILQKEEELMSIVQLIGRDSLAETDKALLDVASLIRNDFLMQNSYTPYDKFCPLFKSVAMLKCILHFHDLTQQALSKQDASGRQLQYITLRQSTEEVRHRLTQMKFINTFEKSEAEVKSEFAHLLQDMDDSFSTVEIL